MLTVRRKPPGRERYAAGQVFNRSVGTLRAAVERVFAYLKDGKILATRYRGPLTALPGLVTTVTALPFYGKGW